MKSELDNDELAQRFLLGNLPESERAEIEDRFFANDNFFQELLIGEDDLIDAYVRGELPAAERALFERCCLSTQTGRERVEFAQALFKSFSIDDPAGAAAAVGAMAREADGKLSQSRWRSLSGAFANRRPALSFALAAALLVIVLGGLWLLMNRVRTRSQHEEVRTMQPTPVAPRESSTPLETAEQQQQPVPDDKNAKPTPPKETPKRTGVTPPMIATLTLQPGMVRDGSGAAVFVLSGKATEVRLRLIVEGEGYEQYRATLSTADGRKLWGRALAKGSSSKSGNLALSLPADLLSNGDYVLELSGAKSDGKWESAADYSFRVVKR